MAEPCVVNKEYLVNADDLFEFCLAACASADLKIVKGEPHLGFIQAKNSMGAFSCAFRMTINIIPQGSSNSILKVETVGLNGFGQPAPIQPKNRERWTDSFFNALNYIVKRSEAMK